MLWSERELADIRAREEARERSSQEAQFSAFIKGFKPQLEIVRGGNEAPEPSPDPQLRGVEEAVSVPPGYRRFITTSSTGELLEDALIVSRLATERYIANRRRLLEMADPERKLEVI